MVKSWWSCLSLCSALGCLASEVGAIVNCSEGGGEGAEWRAVYRFAHKSLDSNLVPPAPGQVQPS